MDIRQDVENIIGQTEQICKQEGGDMEMYKDICTDIICQYIYNGNILWKGTVYTERSLGMATIFYCRERIAKENINFINK